MEKRDIKFVNKLKFSRWMASPSHQNILLQLTIFEYFLRSLSILKKNVVYFKKFQQLLLIFPWQWNTHFGAPLNNFYPPLQHTMGTFSSIAFLCFTISNLSWLPNNPNNRKLYPFFWYPIFFTHINDDQKKLLISTLSLGNLNKFTAVIKWERNLHSRQCV